MKTPLPAQQRRHWQVISATWNGRAMGISESREARIWNHRQICRSNSRQHAAPQYGYQELQDRCEHHTITNKKGSACGSAPSYQRPVRDG